MKDKLNKNVLLFTRSMGLGGTENVVLQLSEILLGLGYNVIVCSNGGVNLSKLKEMGVKHYHIKDITKLIYFFSNLILLYRIIRYENISIIHVHHRMAALYTQFLFSKDKLTKVATVHNTFYNKKFFTKIAYRRMKLIAVGDEVKKNLISYFKIKDSNIRVIRNAIKPFYNDVVMDEKIDYYKSRGYEVVINVGRLTKQKGMEYFVLAAKEVLRKRKNVIFFIIGSGELEDKINSLIEESNISKNVFLMGYRSNVRDLMIQSDLVVLSSLWEGLPLTPIESFSVGKTVVATSVDGTIEIIDNYTNGILVKPKDYTEMGSKILEVLENQDLKRKLETNAYIKYMDSYSIDRLESDYQTFYCEL